MNICNNQSTLKLFELPPEDLVHIASYLSLKSVKQLHATCHELQPVTQLFINADVQNTLEEYILDEPSLSLYLKESKKYCNHSEQRIQILRNAICSLFIQYDCTDDLNLYKSFNWKNSHNSRKWISCCHLDFKLAIQIVEKVAILISFHDLSLEAGRRLEYCTVYLFNVKRESCRIEFQRRKRICLDEKVSQVALKIFQTIEI